MWRWNVIVHLHWLHFKGPQMLEEVRDGHVSSICGLDNLKRARVTSRVSDATCASCLRAEKRRKNMPIPQYVTFRRWQAGKRFLMGLGPGPDLLPEDQEKLRQHLPNRMKGRDAERVLREEMRWIPQS